MSVYLRSILPLNVPSYNAFNYITKICSITFQHMFYDLKFLKQRLENFTSVSYGELQKKMDQFRMQLHI